MKPYKNALSFWINGFIFEKNFIFIIFFFRSFQNKVWNIISKKIFNVELVIINSLFCFFFTIYYGSEYWVYYTFIFGCNDQKNLVSKKLWKSYIFKKNFARKYDLFTAKLVPIGYGIKKLQINCVIEDDKISTDFLEEEITAIEDLVSLRYFHVCKPTVITLEQYTSYTFIVVIVKSAYILRSSGFFLCLYLVNLFCL